MAVSCSSMPQKSRAERECVEAQKQKTSDSDLFGTVSEPDAAPVLEEAVRPIPTESPEDKL